MRDPPVGVAYPPAHRHERGPVPDAPSSARPASPSTPPPWRRLSTLHREGYLSRAGSVVPLPGARELLRALADHDVPFAIATSSAQKVAAVGLVLLDLPGDVPVVTRDLVERAKPDPHLFLAAAERLHIDPARAFVVGDSIWDLLAAQRAGALGIGLLSGGYGPRSCRPRAPTAFTRTRPTCWPISKRWECGPAS